MHEPLIHPVICPFTAGQIQAHFWRPVNRAYGNEIAGVIEWLRPAIEFFEADIANRTEHSR